MFKSYNRSIVQCLFCYNFRRDAVLYSLPILLHEYRDLFIDIDVRNNSSELAIAMQSASRTMKNHRSRPLIGRTMFSHY